MPNEITKYQCILCLKEFNQLALCKEHENKAHLMAIKLSGAEYSTDAKDKELPITVSIEFDNGTVQTYVLPEDAY